jgi:hypothetical protein
MNNQNEFSQKLGVECERSPQRLFAEQEDALIKHYYENLKIKN